MIHRLVLIALLATGLASQAAAMPTLTAMAPLTRLSESGPTSALVNLMLSAPAEEPFIVMVTTSDLTAKSGIDYVPMAEPVTFLPGDIYKQVEVAIIDDPEDEPVDEMFQLTLGDVIPLGDNPLPPVVVALPFLHFTIEDNDHTLSTDAADVKAGEPVLVNINQRFDSQDTVGTYVRITGGTARLGVDIAPPRRTGFLRAGKTEQTLGFETFEGMSEEDRTVVFEVGGNAPGTVTVEPETLRVTIRVEPSEFEPAMLQYGPGTGYIYYAGDLVMERPFPPQNFDIEMRVHMGGSRFTLRQQGTSLTFARVCRNDVDASTAMASIQGMSVEDMREAGEELWRAAYQVDGVPFTYVVAGDPAEKLVGYATSNYSTDGMAHEQYFTYIVTPVAPEDPEMAQVPRLPPERDPVVPPTAARDAVARAIADDMGLSADALTPYLTTSLGSGTNSVKVALWLGPDGQLVQPGRDDLDPCDPGYGEMVPAVSRVIYTVHTFEDRFIVQSKTQDIETGRYERAYMEDLDTASNALDEAVTRAHEGLSPDISAPTD
ncbi:Calx-beta domain-containing protein [Halomonas daqiaonensis]|uniref:Calx-beta domain-containing protein n=2 Tax=Halomonas daqiaonensis TaxID=650850 RepID=A0A1H7FKJ5_9GAMM|nr:Calx-beta domain-containing protein [Halomonas daqiaonensis]